MIRKMLSVCLVLFVLSGCASEWPYRGPYFEPEKEQEARPSMAKIISYYPKSNLESKRMTMPILSLNGEPRALLVYGGYSIIYVKPGDYTASTVFEDTKIKPPEERYSPFSGNRFPENKKYSTRFQAAAGQTYYLKFEVQRFSSIPPPPQTWLKSVKLQQVAEPQALRELRQCQRVAANPRAGLRAVTIHDVKYGLVAWVDR